MKLTLEPTPEIQSVNGQPCRIWKGVDDTGAPVLAHIAIVSPQTHDAAVNERFAQALVELGRATVVREPLVIDMRFIA